MFFVARDDAGRAVRRCAVLLNAEYGDIQRMFLSTSGEAGPNILATMGHDMSTPAGVLKIVPLSGKG